MYHNILIVCLGNICRSPTAERIMQKKLPGHQISSAGIKALAGKDADFQAIKTALKHGVIVAGHTPRQLTALMCEQADLILVMEPSQIDMVADIHPPARSKTMLFAQWLPKKTIPDPYKQSSEMFEAVFEQLNAAADTWKTKLNGKTQPV
ncbi:low molecular weight protein-tyrosine-phosphatase [Neisseria subflava]|uniref:low molecular weight protein-tyrosine-phosphatase n=1 Tax=Neisseria subflava TaxID=28449 RepID=UPI0010BF3EDE|nr:low molecular weight protein-tyrosine-phosphatase [Neisseria subflava]QCL71854.1 low molecular weight phosphotyrosine protein phosphatase [Neisseria subflava]WMS18547.1 low molecular weight protein-tyrosine-phosphatase [Neisseria subflava]